MVDFQRLYKDLSEVKLGTKTVTENGTYSASSDNLDGYSSFSVEVASSGGGTDEYFDWSEKQIISNINNFTFLKGYFNGEFVAIRSTNNYYILTSIDGLNWVQKSSPLPAYYEPDDVTLEWETVSLAYGNGIYVAVLGTGHVVTSTDLVTWTDPVYYEGDEPDYWDLSLGSILFFDGYFHVWGNYGTGISSDGVNWTITAPINAGNYYPYCAKVDSTIISSIFGYSYYGDIDSDGVCSLIISTNSGSTWNTSSPIEIQFPVSEASTTFVLTATPEQFVIVNRNGYVTVSNDGVNWSTPVQNNNLIQPSGSNLRYWWYNIAYGNGKLLLMALVPSAGGVSTAPVSIVPSGTYNVIAKGIYAVDKYANVNVAGTAPTLIAKTITENGTYLANDENVDGFSRVSVNISVVSSLSIPLEVDANGKLQKPTTTPFTLSLPSNATNVKDYVLYYAFYGCTGLTSVDLSSLTTISGSSAMLNAFNGCTGLTGTLDLSNLTTVSGSSGFSQVFSGASKVTKIDLSSLTTVSGSSAMNNTFMGGYTGVTEIDLSSLSDVTGTLGMDYTFHSLTSLQSVNFPSLLLLTGNQAMSRIFQDCTQLSSVSFPQLNIIGKNTSVAGYGHFSEAFKNCNSLTTITFPNLEKIYCTGGSSGSYGTFASNNKVQKMYFPKLDTITYGSGASSTNQNACKNVFYGCSSLTELHFAVANQTAIEASPGYSTAWGRGAGNVTIYFDL